MTTPRLTHFSQKSAPVLSRIEPNCIPSGRENHHHQKQNIFQGLGKNQGPWYSSDGQYCEKTAFVENEIYIPERELIKMAGTIWEIGK